MTPNFNNDTSKYWLAVYSQYPKEKFQSPAICPDKSLGMFHRNSVDICLFQLMLQKTVDILKLSLK